MMMTMLLTGCRQSEHEKLIDDGWKLNEKSDAYIKSVETSVSSEDFQEFIRNTKPFWLSDDKQAYIVFDDDYILVEGVGVYEYYPYDNLEFNLVHVREAPDGSEGKIEESYFSHYYIYIPKPGNFQIAENNIDYMEISVSAPEFVEETLHGVTMLNFLNSQNDLIGISFILRPIDGAQIPREYYYANKVGYSYYIEQQIWDEGMITTGKTTEEIAEKKEDRKSVV